MIDAPDLSGTRLGRFEVLSVLGRGGMGVVYDAIDPNLGRHVALKILPAGLSSDARRLARFVQEARAASALNHPNVVTIHEIGHETIGSDEVHFIVMEKVAGSDLRSSLAGRRMPVRDAVQLVAQVAEAIAAANSSGIVHRDLKPENIILSSDGTPKVLDFGLAKLLPGPISEDQGSDIDTATAVLPTDSGTILGTVGYMSPEQAQGKPADHRSDIFALGCILYEALSGRRAFSARSSVETLNAIIHEDPPPLRQSNPSASPELQRIVSKAMAKSAEDRYQSAKEMAIDLRATLREGTQPEAPPNRSRWVLVAAVVILAAVIATLAIRRNDSARQTAAPVAVANAARAIEVRRLTSRGTVVHAAISPDGKFIAYALLGGSLRLRQIATGQELELVPPGPSSIWGLTFTPDGDSVIYVVKDPRKPVGSCLRIASIGGHPEHLFDGIDTGPSISPDGRRVTFARAEYPHAGESALMVANVDGSGMRAIGTRRMPERFAPLFFGAPAWSPDGRSIAMVVQDAVGSTLVLLDPETGAETPLLDHPWSVVTQPAWLRDSSGIISAASDEKDLSASRLWLFPLRGGAPRLITSDVVPYREASSAVHADLLLSVAIDVNAQVWSVPLTGDGEPQKISGGRADGWRGVAVIPDGRIVYTSPEDNGQLLLISNADGSGATQLVRDRATNYNPTATRDGVVYLSTAPEGTSVCMTDFNGDHGRVLVSNADTTPVAVSPDGEWLVFRRNRRLWRIPMRGGEATQFVSDVSSLPEYSPDGTRIAILIGDPDEYAGRAGVISATDGRLLWSAPLDSVHKGTAIRWARDGKGLIVNGGPKDDRNLWLIPFEGKPRRLTNFADQRAYFWDFAPDGKSVIMSRANHTRDAVLVSGFR